MRAWIFSCCLALWPAFLVASPLQERLKSGLCEEPLSLPANAEIRRWLQQGAREVFPKISQTLMEVADLTKLNPVQRLDRAYTVHEILEVLAHEPAMTFRDEAFNRALWQAVIFKDKGPGDPAFLSTRLFADRLVWDFAQKRPASGEFVVVLSWNTRFHPDSVSTLRQIVQLAISQLQATSVPGGPRSSFDVRALLSPAPERSKDLYVTFDSALPIAERYRLSLQALKIVHTRLAEFH